MILQLGEDFINDVPHVLTNSFTLDDVDNSLIAIENHPLCRRNFSSCHLQILSRCHYLEGLQTLP